MFDAQSDKTSDQIETRGRKYRNQTTTDRRLERRERLVEAAVESISTRGYHATSLEALCASAGISTRNFYEEFANKQALMIGLYDMINQRATDQVATAIHDASPDLPSTVRAGVSGYLDAMVLDRRWARLALVESVGISPEMEKHRRVVLENFARLIAHLADVAAERDELVPRDFRLTAIGAVGAVRELAMLAVVDETVDLDLIAAEASAMLLAGLADR